MRRLLATCVALAPTIVGAQPVARFDWFEYSGRDSVFAKHKPGPNEYQNPIVAGFYPDPSIVRKGNDYYLVNSSFSYFPGVPIFHSTDLAHWTQLGSVLDRPSQLDLDGQPISRGIFAPAISEHAGTFYMITTHVAKGNFVVTATNPAGPWSEPTWLPELAGAIDPSIFFDDDGKAYVVNNGPPDGKPLYEGHRAIWIQQFDYAAKKMVGPRAVIVNGGVDLSKKPIWIEGPHLLKRDGKYYLICAEGGTADAHSEVVFRADAPNGPYVPGPNNPILTQRHLAASRPEPVTATGHADFVDTPSGETWAVFLGVRPYGDQLFNTGRETWLLRVRWVDGWPRILDGDSTVPYVATRPKLPAMRAPSIPLTGNFTVRDEFASAKLAPYWETTRTPRESFYTMRNGALELRARPNLLGTQAQLSFLGRRQQHVNATATTVVRFTPERDGDAAGLVAFMTDDHNLFLAVAREGDKRVVQLVRRDRGPAETIASVPLPSGAGPVYLRIAARAGSYDFAYATAPNAWRTLAADVDGTILSSKKAGGFSTNFVGVLFGLYAQSAAR